MQDHPYTTADEDPFNLHPIVQQVKPIRHRRSSLLDKWILEQQQSSTEYHDSLHLPRPSFSTSDASASASFCNPYLAYPDLRRAPPIHNDDAASIISYDFVDDDDIPANVTHQDTVPQDPPIPFSAPPTKNLTHSLTPAFRNINLPFRSPTSSNNDPSSSRTLSRLSLFQRTLRSNIGISSDNDNTHSRSSSIFTHNRSISQHSAKSNSNINFHSPRANSRWRPSVLGHFYQPSVSQSSVLDSEAHSTPSRPSISSADTFSTSRTATTIESNVLSTPPRILAQDPIGSQHTLSTAASYFPTTSGSSIWYPGHSSSRGSHCQIPSQQRTLFTPELDDNVDIGPPFTRHHDTIRAAIPYSSTVTLPRVNFSSLSTRGQRKKKMLVVSGVGVGETRKEEGIIRWCESFGEVRQIARMPNGDLHVDFRNSEVADTVCRVRAKVHIAGVGSVQLSWFAGHKR